MKKNEYNRLEDVDLLALCYVVWSQKKIVLAVLLVFSIGSVFYAISLNDEFTSVVTLMPEKSSGGQLSGLAAIAGINLGDKGINNEKYYGDIIKSDRVLDALIEKEWAIDSNFADVKLSEFLGLKPKDSYPNPEAVLRFETKEKIRDEILEFSVSRDNGLMMISVTLPLSAKFSAMLANWFADELHRFNTEHKLMKAKLRLYSIEKQLTESKFDLFKAEEALTEFNKSNKNYLKSAELKLQFARLQREVLTENAIYTEVRKQFEIAKINVSKESESITILDKAYEPVFKSGPKRALICVVGFLLGLLLSVFSILLRHFLTNKE